MPPLDQDEGGPPDLVLKLAFQFFEWEGERYFSSDAMKVLNNVDLVCKKWRRLIEEDDVGRQLSINQIKKYSESVSERNRNFRAQAENDGREFIEKTWDSPRHELLVRMMSAPLPEGRTFKDMYLLSETIGTFLVSHEMHGPDVGLDEYGGEGERGTLREVCLHDCRWTVMPTIEKLRQVFDDPQKQEREQDVMKMKQRILSHARSNGRASLVREDPLSLEKEALVDIAGKYIMMLAASNSLDENIFHSCLNVSVSLGDIINGIESFTGEEKAAQMKKTSSGMTREFSSLPGSNKKLKQSLEDIDWPMSPMDCLTLIVREYWLTKTKLMYTLDEMRGCTEEEWNDAIIKWWITLPEPMRQLLVATYTRLSEILIDIEPLASDLKSSVEVPTETLKLLLDLSYRHGRKEVAKLIFRHLDPNLCKDLFKIYHQQAQAYSDAIRQNYNSVYSNNDTPEHNARILLDIFLEVPCFENELRLPTAPLASENCDELLARMETAMNNWNELVDRVKTEDVLWNPETIIELTSFDQMWGHIYHLNYKAVMDTATARQFYVPKMLSAFLCRILGTNQKLRYYDSLREEARKLFDEMRSKGITTLVSSEGDSNCDYYGRAVNLVNDYRALSIHANTKEHAMMALVPLLTNLSHCDAKRLIYALFTERHASDWSRYDTEGFSKSYFGGTGRMYTKNIPCAFGDGVDAIDFESDMSQLSKWAYDYDLEGYYENSILGRIFGLPLPANIISAMGEFMVENLYQDNINDVDSCKLQNAIGVAPFIKRYCYENPDNRQLVWPYLQRAIENAILVVEGLEPNDVSEEQESNFVSMTIVLANCCIMSRAYSLIPLLTRLEDTQALVPEIIRNVANLADRFEKAASEFIDTGAYFDVKIEDQDL